MISAIFGKVLASRGVVFNGLERTVGFLKELEPEPVQLLKRDTLFKVNKEFLLCLSHQGKEYPLSVNALKNVCKILKIPASYINKTASEKLTERILAESPEREDGQWTLFLWKDINSGEPFVAGVKEGPLYSNRDFLAAVTQSGILDRNNLEVVQHAVNTDIIAVYALSKEKKAYDLGNKFDYKIGLALFHSETSDQGFVMRPYYEIYSRNALGETLTFDFVSSEALVKIPGKTGVYSQEIAKTLSEFDLGKLSEDFEVTIQLLNAVFEADTISYGLLKKARGFVRRVFNSPGSGDLGKEATAEIIPEYSEFRNERKEQLKEMKPFLANNLTANFHFPLYFHRLYQFPATVEAADSFILSKEVVYKTMAELAERINIGNIS